MTNFKSYSFRSLRGVDSVIRAELPGPGNAGLRAKIRGYLNDAEIPNKAAAILSLRGTVALTANGKAAIEKIAEAVR